jgi:shikimate kinase
MASGKTVVGRRLASRLGWRHVDLDREIEGRTGRKVSQIFAEDGEEAFRALEVRVTPSYTALDHVVISPGGGWITNAGLFDRLPPGTLTAWLKVSPEEVVRRSSTGFGAGTRPLLQHPDPLSRARTLLAEREPLYGRARIVIDTEGQSVEEIVQRLVKIVHRGPDADDPRGDAQYGS